MKTIYINNLNILNSSFSFAYNGMLKTSEIAGEGNDYDFGARLLDARIGRMFSKDKYGYVYPHLSPYTGMANNPIANIDIQGNLIIFVGGYWMGLGHFATTKYKKFSSYWNKDFVSAVGNTVNDNKAIYFNGSSKRFEGASSLINEKNKDDGDDESTTPYERYNHGYSSITKEKAEKIYQELAKQRIDDPDKKITVVGHSMGVAESAGIIQALLDAKDDNGKNMFTPDDFGNIYALQGYQTNRVIFPGSVSDKVIQRNFENDPIAGNLEMLFKGNYQYRNYEGINIAGNAHMHSSVLQFPNLFNQDNRVNVEDVGLSNDENEGTLPDFEDEKPILGSEGNSGKLR